MFRRQSAESLCCRGLLAALSSVSLLAACSTINPYKAPAPAQRAPLTAFELMLSGFPECVFKDVYIDLQTRKPVHAYFKERRLVPQAIAEDLAVFPLDESFHGLRVDKIVIPASTFDVHTIYIDAPEERVRTVLSPLFPKGFYTLRDEDLGDKPVLLSDPSDQNRSILTCGPRE